eukprot:m.27659 g.27659  ORF g.27659 m.27659 type:complete len:1297 (+) comp30246_c0_seq2:58-3948(+)
MATETIGEDIDGVCSVPAIEVEGEIAEERASTSESDDSEIESGLEAFTRRMSTILSTGRKSKLIKEGELMKQSGSFQRLKRRYFTLHRGVLFFSKEKRATVHEKIDLKNASVADCGAKGSHSFTVITPHRTLVLWAENRKEMEEWVSAFQSAINSTNRSDRDFDVESQETGMHHWFACSHARPTYCNVCFEALGGMTSRGLSCEVCKFKAHKRCAVYAPINCKWVTVKMIPPESRFADDQIAMKHQWIRGNLPIGSKCYVCDKACGSVRRLQDWRCLWCRAFVHDDCKECFEEKCDLGSNRVSVLPPSAIRAWDGSTKGRAEAVRPSVSSPLLVFVNSKSGDNHGVKFLRRFKQLLNPAQVFDLMTSGPSVGLRLFQSFESFRILVCGGDGSIGWVLTELDKLGIVNKCQVGVLPLGTGNDLARVLGWGATCDDDTQLPNILREMESSGVKMVDRWSIQTKMDPGSQFPPSNMMITKLPALPPVFEPSASSERFLSVAVHELAAMAELQSSVVSHLSVILGEESADKEVINSARVLCEQVKAFVSSSCDEVDGNSLKKKCLVLNDKLSSLLLTLEEEVSASESPSESMQDHKEDLQAMYEASEPSLVLPPSIRVFRSRDAVMSRANSLKKAVKEILAHAEQVIDNQVNEQTAECEALSRLTLESSAVATTGSPTTSTDLLLDPSVYSDEGISDACSDERDSSQPLSTTPPSNRKQRKLHRARMTSSDSGFGSGRTKISGGGGEPTQPAAETTDKKRKNSKPFMPSLAAALLKSASALVTPITSAATFPDVPPPPPPGSDPGFGEVNVMNNYFGIGLDAKISLDFHNKREEHPEKCRSRMLNKMWYGMLGGKEFLSQTYKNLHQRMVLECDGKLIPLPSLQGLVILNIPSYMGGINFWGTEKEKDGFFAPSFDDKMLEVIAVMGVSQMAKSRMLGVQSHRLSQCRSLKITIYGECPIPCQVDGEAWLQPPGQIKMTHKNRVQMLARNKAFYSTLQSWKTHGGSCSVPSRPSSGEMLNMPQPLGVKDVHEYWPLAEKTLDLVQSLKSSATSNESVARDLLPLAQAALGSIECLFPSGLPTENAHSGQAEELVIQVKKLMQESGWFIAMKKLIPSDENEFDTSLRLVESEMRKIQGKDFSSDQSVSWPNRAISVDETLPDTCSMGRGRSNTDPAADVSEVRRFSTLSSKSSDSPKAKHAKKGRRLRFIGKIFGKKSQKYSIAKEQQSQALNWSVADVQQFLEENGFSAYMASFLSKGIRGHDLLSLNKESLEDLGVMKGSHVKRFCQLIQDLQGNSAIV